jgi:tagatose 1,6-diphosphate aldolase
MEELSKDVYQVDILKVEFPINSAYLGEAYSREEALDCYRRVDAAARRPYIYLSAGVSAAQFREQLALASESGARYSGVLCGRATWQDGVPVYAKHGRKALEEWLKVDGIATIQAVNDSLRSATSWQNRLH